MKISKDTNNWWFEECPFCNELKNFCITWSMWDGSDPIPMCWPVYDQEEYEDFINNQRKYG